MLPELWGPAIWAAMLACAWNVQTDDKKAAVVACMFTEILPLTIPCEKCRQHYQTHLRAMRRRDIVDGASAFEFVWVLKNHVNKMLGTKSITRSALKTRICLHNNHVDVVQLADVLVLVAIDAEARDRVAMFARLCHMLSDVLPLVPSSEFVRGLAKVESRRHMHDVANKARRAAHFPVLPLSHYEAIAQT